MVQMMALAADVTQAAGTTTTKAGGLTSLLPMLLMWALIIGAMYFLMIRPQRKRQKEEQKMRSGVRVGDEITTVGGVCGRVVAVKEDALVIETGADRTKMVFKKWALQSVDTVHDAPADDDDGDDDDDDDI